MEDLSKILLREEAIEPLFQMMNMTRMSRMGIVLMPVSGFG